MLFKLEKLLFSLFINVGIIMVGFLHYFRRSLMYVPGNDERKIGKIPQLGADCICLDCEDGVALNMKVDMFHNYLFLSCHITFRIFH